MRQPLTEAPRSQPPGHLVALTPRPATMLLALAPLSRSRGRSRRLPLCLRLCRGTTGVTCLGEACLGECLLCEAQPVRQLRSGSRRPADGLTWLRSPVQPEAPCREPRPSMVFPASQPEASAPRMLPSGPFLLMRKARLSVWSEQLLGGRGRRPVSSSEITCSVLDIGPWSAQLA